MSATLCTKPVSRLVRGRSYALVVTVTPEGLYLREKGRRLKVGPLDLGRIYQRAVADGVARAPRQQTHTRTHGMRSQA